MDAKLNDLPQDRESLQAILCALIVERDEQRLRAEQHRREELQLMFVGRLFGLRDRLGQHHMVRKWGERKR